MVWHGKPSVKLWDEVPRDHIRPPKLRPVGHATDELTNGVFIAGGLILVCCVTALPKELELLVDSAS